MLSLTLLLIQEMEVYRNEQLEYELRPTMKFYV